MNSTASKASRSQFRRAVIASGGCRYCCPDDFDAIPLAGRLMFVLGECEADPSGCSCCDHAYDAGRLAATLWLARDLRMPWDWRLDEALRLPVEQSWLREHFLPILDEIRATNSPEWENYTVRQAALAVAIVREGPWAPPTRKAVAWALVRAGMIYHHWILDPSESDAELIVAPPENFWEQFDDFRVLSELLDRAYVYGGESS